MAFMSQQMSAPLQRRAPSRFARHGARIAETLHHLRRCRALAGGKGTAQRRARLGDASREAAQRPQVNGGCLGEGICCISVSPAHSGSASFLSPQQLGDTESGSSGESVLIRCFCLPKNKSKHILFTQGDLFCREVPAQPARGAGAPPCPEPEQAVGLQVLPFLGRKGPAAAYSYWSCFPSVNRYEFTEKSSVLC